MKVGDKVWLFDQNRRIYQKDGIISASPIYSEHFRQAKIEGETSRSWIIYGEKYPKASPGFFTDAEKEEDIWDKENRMRLIEQVRRCPIKTLREIDAILAQQKEEPTT